MFDLDCQMRFWKSATDAAFGYASATLAAVTVMQERVQDEMSGTEPQDSAAPFPFGVFNPFALPFQWWNTPLASSAFAPFSNTAASELVSAFFPFAPKPEAQIWNPLSVTGLPAFPFLYPSSLFAGAPFSAQAFDSSWSSQWVELMRGLGWPLPQPTWTMWQHPMTAALMAAGLPYSVASPTARANASAMDAADAARDGFNRAFSSYHSDSGHAAAHVAPPDAVTSPDFMSMMMAPWMAFAESPAPRV